MDLKEKLFGKLFEEEDEDEMEDALEDIPEDKQDRLGRIGIKKPNEPGLMDILMESRTEKIDRMSKENKERESEDGQYESRMRDLLREAKKDALKGIGGIKIDVETIKVLPKKKKKEDDEAMMPVKVTGGY